MFSFFTESSPTFAQLIRQQVDLHPSITPQDAMKMCFQAAYGAEHLLTDIDKVRAYFIAEYEACKPTQEPISELIAPNVCRANLAAWKAHGHPWQLLFDLFVQSANTPMPDGDVHFHEYINAWQKLAGAGVLPFGKGEWDTFVSEYFAMCQGKPKAVHHSQQYRDAERPAYRVVVR